MEIKDYLQLNTYLVNRRQRLKITRLLTLRSFIIPKSAFPNEEHARAFLETALAYNAGTHAAPASPHAANAAWPPLRADSALKSDP